ncbi:alpha/beta hydrolase [Dissulfurirhabdus thermomarina]|uniref:Alpha/beta hydrolase n=1 Tax=Dissulfurirhabdus thermomarina TaxID=1765737 RepID=A0A6N9TPS4_DISTH|nr:alpha/beta hydrolase [Dissulfurirhabdus thermomarina]NDY42440.1 alpha/beta hydrolase [Dissulfurirhabdus thermomarina]NMX23376.1 alpha/beta hydrolase [Dissulfurirhabdus thermomarina]
MSPLDRPELLARLRPGVSGLPPEAPEGGELLRFAAADGTALAARVWPGDPAEPHILFYPGEGLAAGDLLALAEGFAPLGLTFAAMDWRGSGASGGTPSLDTLPEDASAGLQALLGWKADRGRPGPVVAMGQSLGASAALAAAVRHEADLLALVMESGFRDSTDLFAALGLPAEWAPAPGSDPFDNPALMRGFTKPVLFIHSQRDPVVSPGGLEWVVSESRSKSSRFQIIPGQGRLDIARRLGEAYHALILEFLNHLLGRRPRRRRR